MPSLPNRREFLRRMSLATAAASVMNGNAQAFPSPIGHTAQIANDVLRSAFDVKTGQFHVWRTSGVPLLEGAVARVITARDRRTSAQPQYRRTVQTRPWQDRLGAGERLDVVCADEDHELDLELRITLYEGRPAVLIEALCRNASANPLTIESLEPLCADPEHGGCLHWPDTSKLLTNGPMYYDPGSVLEFTQPMPNARRSWWNIGLFQGYHREGLACGYVENRNALGQVLARRAPDGSIGLIAESVLAKGFVLEPGRTIASERFMINLAPNPCAALEDYAAAMGTLQSARVHSIINGWCDWFFAFEHITEEEMVRNAEVAARVLKPLGLEYIQVDEGFQRWHGEWEGNARFPHGMKWLANRIRALGLKPGIWLAPYVISEPARVFQAHPEWLLRHPDGQLKRVGPWPSEDSDWARNENPKRYGLDITHPSAAQWLANLFDTVGNQWGYDMVKIDFVDWSLLSAHRYHDPTVSRAAAYRKGFEIMRRALGPTRHLQDCGPGPVTVGLLDSMRIELDQNYGFRQNAWKQYFNSPTCSAAAVAKRYYFHRRTWINDADHLCLQLLSLPQAQAAASLLALSGGNLLSGDRLTDLDPARMEILKKTLPSAGEAARPVDLFDADVQRVFALTLRRRFGEWTVVGLFNPHETDTIHHNLPLERLWLNPVRTYLAYDFWKESFIGEVQGTLQIQTGPENVTLLALHEKRGTPQVLSTDRHVLQGAVELEDVAWDAATDTLQGVSLGPRGSAHNLAVYVPDAQPWKQGGPFLHHDFPHYTLKMMGPHLLRVHVRFSRQARVNWRVPFADFLGRRTKP